MAHRGVFAHLALRLSAHPENVATEALAYILRESPSALRALHTLAAQAVAGLPALALVETQAAGDDGAIPDLIGFDANGRSPLLAEAKFGAGFTSHQPVTYLRRLPDDEAGLLLVIAPARRLDMLWAELLRRVEPTEFSLGSEGAQGGFRWAAVDGSRTMGLVGWDTLLRVLNEAVTIAGDLQAQGNIDQLAGLAERMDSEVFTPLVSEELTGSQALRTLQLFDIVDAAVSKLIETDVASRSDAQGQPLGGSSGRGFSGKYLALESITCFLRVNWEHWAHELSTPLWLQVGYRGKPTAAETLHALRPLHGRVFEHTYCADVAIFLPTGVDLPDVVAAVVAQVTEVKMLLAAGLSDRVGLGAQAPPNTSSSTL